MKTKKSNKIRNTKLNFYKSLIKRIQTWICASLCIILLLIMPVIPIKAQPGNKKNIIRNSQVIEIEKRLKDLNASVSGQENKNAANTKRSAKNIKKNDDNKKSSSKKMKKEIPDKTSKKKTTKSNTQEKNKPDKKIDKNDTKKEKKFKIEKKKAENIKNAIEYGTHKERKQAINLILMIKNKSIKKNLTNILIKIIKNELDSGVKIKAITVAGELKLKESLKDIIKCFEDESFDVKVSSVYAVKKIGDISAKPELIKKLKEQELEKSTLLTEALIDTLGKFKAVELIDFAKEAINNSKTDHLIREMLVLYLGRIEAKGSKDLLIGLLKDEEENKQIRAFAANSLAKLKITEASDDIESVITKIESFSFKKKKKYYNLYIYCVAALAKLGKEEVIPRLINALRSDNAVVRLKAIKLIKEINEKRTIDILKYKMKYDQSKKVQKAAQEALKELNIDVDESDDSGKEKQKIKKDNKEKIDSKKKSISRQKGDKKKKADQK